MIVYSSETRRFIEDVRSNQIHARILAELRRKLSMNVGANEVSSWRNSMQYMCNLLSDDDIPRDSRVSIEYNIPLTSKRIDFILTGRDEANTDTAVLIELKQWSDVKRTTKDAIVKTFLGGSERETSHPSYQCWTYAALIKDYNETVRDDNISLKPCAYLHNLDSADEIAAPFYAEHIDKAPIFISKDALKLAAFLKKHIKLGDLSDIMYRIEHGKIKPSRSLADSLVSMLNGNREFLMIDDQKVVYEAAIDAAHRAPKDGKQVLIVQGGPGTGKSVVAVNLLVELTNREMVVQYTSKNAAPRAVYAAKLTGTLKKTHINALFRGSGSYTRTDSDIFDVLIVDEAHRLNEKSGLYANLGLNQIKEIISASKTSIFFIDEDQRVTMKDIGEVESIRMWARDLGATVEEYTLASQFRCGGSDGYLAWLDQALQIRGTANLNLDTADFDFRVFDDPGELRSTILNLNKAANKARMVAGYCWNWNSKKNPSAMDIVMPEYNFEAQWNLTQDGSLWIMADSSVDQIGCIHTCQGLEVDYIGVIIGPDFKIRDGEAVTDARSRSKMDASIKGYLTLSRSDPEEAKRKADLIIKNTYRTLLTRGMKGCFLFCTDPETNAYFKAMLAAAPDSNSANEAEPRQAAEVIPFDASSTPEDALPVYDLKVAAGLFSGEQTAAVSGWRKCPNYIRMQEGLFVAQVVGESMNRRIPNGSWCLFKKDPAGTRNGKVVLVQHRDVEDSELGGHYTLKRYLSEKAVDAEDGVINQKVILRPESSDPRYQDIILDSDEAEEHKVVAEFLTVLDDL